MALFNGNNMKKDITGEMLLEQWGKCVDMANSISDKRINSNGIFLALESALVALITFTFDAKSLILSVGISAIPLLHSIYLCETTLLCCEMLPCFFPYKKPRKLPFPRSL